MMCTTTEHEKPQLLRNLEQLAAEFDVEGIKTIITKSSVDEEDLTHALNIAIRAFRTHGAKRKVKFEIFELLLGAGAKIPDPTSDILVHYCSYYGKFNVLKLLMACTHHNQIYKVLNKEYRVAEISSKPLMLAIVRGNKNCVLKLLKHSPLWVIKDQLFQAIHIAVEKEHLSVLKNLLQHSKRKLGILQMQSLLVRALEEEDKISAEALIKHNVSIVKAMRTLPNKLTWEFILTHAAASGNPSLKRLVFRLVESDKEECLRYVLESEFRSNLDLDALVDKQTVLLEVLERNNLNVLNQLLQYDLDVNKCNDKQHRPIFRSLSCDDSEFDTVKNSFLKPLVLYGCDVNVSGYWNGDPTAKLVSIALREKRVGLLNILYLAGADFAAIIPKGIESELYIMNSDCKMQEMKLFIDKTILVPQTLQHLSRIVIRKSLGMNIPRKVSTLTTLPHPLQQYILLSQELNDICDDIPQSENENEFSDYEIRTDSEFSDFEIYTGSEYEYEYTDDEYDFEYDSSDLY